LDDGDGTASEVVSSISVLSETSAATAIDIIDRALKDIASERSNLGAVVNRLDHTVNNLTNIVVNTEASRGRIEDADFATESTALSKAQILQQASTAMLAQANASKQGVLSLLQG
jgi:flagellin